MAPGDPAATGQGRPELRLEIVRLSIENTQRQPSTSRDWNEVERLLDEARKAQPEATEALDLLQADLLVAQEKWDEARAVLTAAKSRNPRSLQYRLALARLSERDRTSSQTLQILDQAEKDLGPLPEIRLARLGFWARHGGNEARAAVANLAEGRNQIPAADRPNFLDQLGKTELRLDEPALARQHWRELSAIQPENIPILWLASTLPSPPMIMPRLENSSITSAEPRANQGTNWRFAQALELINRARRGDSTALQTASTLASEIAARRRDWWGVSLLNAQIAELQNQPEQALTNYMEAVKLGNGQPAVVRRLVLLLYQRNRFEDIERLAQLLRNRDIALAELTTLASALNALRRGTRSMPLRFSARSCPTAQPTSPISCFSAVSIWQPARRPRQKRTSSVRRRLGPGVPGGMVVLRAVPGQHQASGKGSGRRRSRLEKTRPGGPSLTLALGAMLIGDNELAEKSSRRFSRQIRKIRLACAQPLPSISPEVERIWQTRCWILFSIMLRVPPQSMN